MMTLWYVFPIINDAKLT